MQHCNKYLLWTWGTIINCQGRDKDTDLWELIIICRSHVCDDQARGPRPRQPRGRAVRGELRGPGRRPPAQPGPQHLQPQVHSGTRHVSDVSQRAEAATTADFYGTAGDFTPPMSGRGRGWPPWGASSRTTGSGGSSYPPGNYTCFNLSSASVSMMSYNCQILMSGLCCTCASLSCYA